VKLYDVAGKLCRTLVSQEQKSGLYQPTWDRTDNRGRSVPCGIYFCQMQTDSYLSQKKVVLVK
jgi:flagellar hook assembly protein FlgD